DELETPSVMFSEHARIRSQRLEEFPWVLRRERQGDDTGLGLGQEQQLLDDPAQACEPPELHLQSLLVSWRQLAADEEFFSLEAGQRQRRLELVGSLRGEAPDLVERVFEPV